MFSLNLNLSIFFSLFLTFQVFASAKMVFLVEGPRGKQVGISQDFQNYKFHTTSRSRWHLYPDISPAGDKIVYVQGNDQKSLQVIIEDLNSSKKRIIGNKGFVLHPRFAKEGKLLFVSEKLGNSNKVFKYDLTKKKATKTQITYVDSFFPSPFSDGDRLVFQRNTQGRREIVYKDLTDNDVGELIIGEGMSPSLSKDERFIAFTSKVDNNWDIYIYDILTKVTKRVTTDENRDFSPSFDREGNLIFTSDRMENGVFSIYRISATKLLSNSGSEELLISKAGTSFYAPRVSGNSKVEIKQAKDLTGIERSSFGSINHLGRIYVVGGHQGKEHTYPPESFTGRVSAYDTDLKIWINLAPRLHPSHGFQLAADGFYIYAFGGFAYDKTSKPRWKSLSVVERYSIRENKWEVIGHLPRKRSSNLVSQVGRKIYLIGGWDATPKFENDYDGTFHTEIDTFDLDTLSFSTLDVRLPTKRRAFNGFVRNNKIYLVGGLGEGATHFELIDSFTEFDPVKNTFKELAPLPFATFAPATGTIRDKAFMFGGMFKLGKMSYIYVPHIYEYSFKDNFWVHSGRYLKESKGFSQVVKLGDGLGILGGHAYLNMTDSPVNTFEIFNYKN